MSCISYLVSCASFKLKKTKNKTVKSPSVDYRKCPNFFITCAFNVEKAKTTALLSMKERAITETDIKDLLRMHSFKARVLKLFGLGSPF